MMTPTLRQRWQANLLLLLPALLGLLSETAQALPSYARQTGSECVACHTSGMGHHLTPHGMWFKMNGYTEGDQSSLPISAQVRLSHNETASPSRYKSDRLDEASIYLAGRIAPKLGAFVKATHTEDPFNTGEAPNDRLQQLDLRFADNVRLFDRDATWGVALSNQPGNTDPLDANQAWNLPAVSTVGSMFNPTGAATLPERVLGLTSYLFFDNHWYAEVGGYRALSRAAQHKLGLDPEGDPGRTSGVAPYWRLAYLHDLKTQFFGGGLYGMRAKRQLALLNPNPRTTARVGPYDSLNDLGMDAIYEYLGNREHVLQLRANFVREERRYGSTPTNPFTGAVAPANATVRERTLAATYVYHQAYGATAALLTTQTSQDAVRSFPFGVSDSRIRYFEAFWTPFGKEDSWMAPWANLKLQAVWMKFDKFNGGAAQIFGPFSPNSRDLDFFQLHAQITF